MSQPEITVCRLVSNSHRVCTPIPVLSLPYQCTHISSINVRLIYWFQSCSLQNVMHSMLCCDKRFKSILRASYFWKLNVQPGLRFTFCSSLKCCGWCKICVPSLLSFQRDTQSGKQNKVTKLWLSKTSTATRGAGDRLLPPSLCCRHQKNIFSRGAKSCGLHLCVPEK